MGYDVHKLTEDRKLILGGVEIPHTLGLLGHSDADVLLHAIMDALLGAAALGDIGKHFPDTDEKYRGISSLKLLEHVGNLLEQSGVNVLYTRVNDVFDTPLEKAQMGNQSGADYFISIHRNAMPIPGSASGAEVLVYQDEGVPALLAENISRNLTEAGFADLGVQGAAGPDCAAQNPDAGGAGGGRIYRQSRG